MVAISQEACLKIEKQRTSIRKEQESFTRLSSNQKLMIAQKVLAEFSLQAYVYDCGVHEDVQPGADFIKQAIDCLQCGNCYVIFVNLDWHNFSGYIHPLHEAFIASQYTKVVMLEYFNPELFVNAERVPLLGKLARWLWSRKYYQESDRIRFAKVLERACVKYEKPVTVTDIAHNTNYSFNFYLSYLVSFVMIGASLFHLLPNYRVALLLASCFLYHRLDTGLRRLGKRLGRKLSLGGAFDPEHVHWYEKFFLDLEDARRVLGAAGIRQLVREYTDNEQDTPAYIIVNLPPAHGIRYASVLLDATRADVWARSIKQTVYGLLPNISRSVRTWVYKRSITRTPQNSDDTAAGIWVCTSKRKITF